MSGEENVTLQNGQVQDAAGCDRTPRSVSMKRVKADEDDIFASYSDSNPESGSEEHRDPKVEQLRRKMQNYRQRLKGQK